MKIYLLRHGQTEGNRRGRYIGTTDEPLLEESVRALSQRTALPAPDALYVSPMLRCRQTARVLYPNREQILADDLRECDFGMFENKNYRELANCREYQAWIDSGGTLPFPGGESLESFQKRCVHAFCEILKAAQKNGCRTIACVIHGGTIMAVLSALAKPKRPYYDYQVKNGCGYVVSWEARGEHTVDFPLSICYSISENGTGGEL